MAIYSLSEAATEKRAWKRRKPRNHGRRGPFRAEKRSGPTGLEEGPDIGRSVVFSSLKKLGLIWALSASNDVTWASQKRRSKRAKSKSATPASSVNMTRKSSGAGKTI